MRFFPLPIQKRPLNFGIPGSQQTYHINPGGYNNILRFRGQRLHPEEGCKHWDSAFRFRMNMDWLWIKCSPNLMITWNDHLFLFFSLTHCWRWQKTLLKLTLLGHYSDWWWAGNFGRLWGVVLLTIKAQLVMYFGAKETRFLGKKRTIIHLHSVDFPVPMDTRWVFFKQSET